MKNTK
jgi:hypothetical protein